MDVTAGLQAATQPPAMAPVAPPPAPVMFANGLVRMVGNKQLEAEAKAAALQANNAPVIQGLAAHVRSCWSNAMDAKMITVEQRMLKSVRQRRGEYDPEVLAEIRKSGGSEVYMMLTSNKCRAAASWLRDVLLGIKGEKPWTIDPSPLPDLPPSMAQSIAKMAYQEAMEYQQATQSTVGQKEMEEVVSRIKDRIITNAKKKAKEVCERMEIKMEDQLLEGGFQKAFSEFLDDIVTFPSAFIKGPVVRKKTKLKWVPDQANAGNFQLELNDEYVLEWNRVDPFNVYPSPMATTVDDGLFIERHRLSRSALNELIGVEGYSEQAIRAVLDEHGRNGLRNWLYIDAAKAEVEGKALSSVYQNVEGEIDALQFWGSVQGKHLIEWGMKKEQVPDELKEYPCEVWVVGTWVIKATINSDPLGRRPYYKASYEEVPGCFWGNSVADLARDSQTQCNTAARAIANNMNLASGPQVVYNVDRLPPGEDITQIYPWKIWQATSDPYGSTTAKPVEFFMPKSISGELMAIYTFFSNLADEHTGVPRYITGDAHIGGAGRTASGMSMLMNNAGKAIKQVIANIDVNVLEPLVDRLYFYNMYHGDDPHLKGDISVRARGAAALMVKEQAQVRINEYLAVVASNPVFTNIVGEESIAALLREGAKMLDLDTDQIVPPPEIIRARMHQQKMESVQQQQLAIQMASAPEEEIQFNRNADGTVESAQVVKWQHAPPGNIPPKYDVLRGGAPGAKKIMPGNKQQLQNGAPVTDNFAPARQA